MTGGGGAALVGPCNETGGLGAGRLGTRPFTSFSCNVSAGPGLGRGTGGGDRGFSKLVSWFAGNLGLGGGLIMGVNEL
jgi:hypothetical protein